MATPISRIRIRSSKPTRENKCRTRPFIQSLVRWRSNMNWWRHTWCPFIQSRSNSSRVSRFWPNLQEGKAPDHYSEKKKKILTIKVAPFTLINGNLYKLGLEDILRQCALEHERHDIIQEVHSGAVGGHFLVDITIKKILQFGLWWPSINKYCKYKITQCDACQRIGRPLQKNEMPLLPISPSLTFETL